MGKYYQKVLTKTLAPVIWQLGIDKLFKNNFSGRGNILMFHRVIPKISEARIHNHLSMEIDPNQLDSVIKFFKNNKNYDFISLNDLNDWFENNKFNNRKFVVFTFDDGYLDNLTYAYPIFKKWNIPFTIYVTTSFPENNAILWWYMLEKIVLKNNSISFPQNGNNFLTFDCTSTTKKESAFNAIRKEIMAYNEIERDLKLKNFFTNYDGNLFENKERLTLTWEEIKQLSDDSLVSIGAHTLNHYNLCAISLADAKIEIKQSKELLESKINKTVGHFSYPLGKYNDTLAAYVSQQKFISATTTRTANIFPEHLDHMFQLPRISINSLTTDKVLRLQVNGFFPAILNNLTKMVW
jgi:peptidoglycan/xylan/chitin deacetylase (PgdA/CDA1 family)